MKYLKFAALHLVLFSASGLIAQNVTTTIPGSITGNISFNSVVATFNQTVEQPPTSIPLSQFQFNQGPFQLSTTSPTGNMTFWSGFVSVSSSGNITGNAKVEYYDSNGNLTATVNATTSNGSKVFYGNFTASNASTQIQVSSKRAEIHGAYSQNQNTIILADYPADVLVKWSLNNSASFVMRGKAILVYKKIYNITSSREEGQGVDDSETKFNLSVFGTGNHAGNIITGSVFSGIR